MRPEARPKRTRNTVWRRPWRATRTRGGPEIRFGLHLSARNEPETNPKRTRNEPETNPTYALAYSLRPEANPTRSRHVVSPKPSRPKRARGPAAKPGAPRPNRGRGISRNFRSGGHFGSSRRSCSRLKADRLAAQGTSFCAGASCLRTFGVLPSWGVVIVCYLNIRSLFCAGFKDCWLKLSTSSVGNNSIRFKLLVGGNSIRFPKTLDWWLQQYSLPKLWIGGNSFHWRLTPH